MHADGEFLDGQYAAFGKVVSGMETVDEIAAVRTNRQDRPLTDQVIDTVRVID
jgi:peptidyl-prolyl cis-trans isomerase B (cyclophilin B)